MEPEEAARLAAEYAAKLAAARDAVAAEYGLHTTSTPNVYARRRGENHRAYQKWKTDERWPDLAG